MTARLGRSALEALAARLSARERAIIEDVGRVRVLTSAQVERLHFDELQGASRQVVRRRVLGRLVSARVLATLQRRIGGVRAGSAGLVYCLDVVGHQLLLLWSGQPTQTGRRLRSPWTPGLMFLTHSLATSELYVQLRERERTGRFALDVFLVEPASWSPNGLSGWLRPDAYTVLSTNRFVDAWWIEVDRATETVPTMRRKLLDYLDFVHRGQVGPDQAIPGVLITVPDTARRDAVQELVTRLPSPADELFHVVEHVNAVEYVTTKLQE